MRDPGDILRDLRQIDQDPNVLDKLLKAARHSKRAAWGRAAGLQERHRISYERWIKSGTAQRKSS